MATLTASSARSTRRGSAPRKAERLVARVSPDDKLLLARAAALAGQSLGGYVLAQARKAALDEVERADRIRLDAAQTRAFVRALAEKPRRAPAAVVEAYADYRKSVVER